MNKLNPMAMGLAFGILWAAGVLIIALLAMSNGYGSEMIEALGTVYLGLEATLTGALIGAVWGFVDAFIGGYLLAWLYNKFL